MSADERREEVLAAAVAEFAAYGLHGASTEAIAERAGISQPYIFRLFGTKKDLFIAAAERVLGRIMDTFRDAVAAEPDRPLHAMGEAYERLLVHREEFLMLLQAFAASADDDLRKIVRRDFGRIYDLVEGASGADETEIQRFMAYGMLLMVTTALDVPALVGKEDWAAKMLTKKQFGDHCD